MKNALLVLGGLLALSFASCQTPQVKSCDCQRMHERVVVVSKKNACHEGRKHRAAKKSRAAKRSRPARRGKSAKRERPSRRGKAPQQRDMNSLRERLLKHRESLMGEDSKFYHPRKGKTEKKKDRK